MAKLHKTDYFIMISNYQEIIYLLLIIILYIKQMVKRKGKTRTMYTKKYGKK